MFIFFYNSTLYKTTFRSIGEDKKTLRVSWRTVDCYGKGLGDGFHFIFKCSKFVIWRFGMPFYHSSMLMSFNLSRITLVSSWIRVHGKGRGSDTKWSSAERGTFKVRITSRFVCCQVKVCVCCLVYLYYWRRQLILLWKSLKIVVWMLFRRIIANLMRVTHKK